MRKQHLIGWSCRKMQSFPQFRPPLNMIIQSEIWHSRMRGDQLHLARRKAEDSPPGGGKSETSCDATFPPANIWRVWLQKRSKKKSDHSFSSRTSYNHQLLWAFPIFFAFSGPSAALLLPLNEKQCQEPRVINQKSQSWIELYGPYHLTFPPGRIRCWLENKRGTFRIKAF